MCPQDSRARRRRLLGSSLLCSVIGLALAAAPAQAIIGGTTETFSYTGAEQTFNVPAGVFGVRIYALGGAGGGAGTKAGGEGALVSGSFSVTPGQTLYVEVGGKGKSEAEGGEGGFNGGGEGAGGGGGASDVRTSPRSTSLTVTDSRLIVAGGGGGAGASGSEPGGAGGAAEKPGEETTYPGGGAGGQSEGGLGASGCEISGGGSNGELGNGGIGGDSMIETGPGGGGGGGLYGGGGGGGACYIGSSGGGGGSSLTEGFTSWSSGAPMIEITYYPPPSATITSPAEGAAYSQGKAVNASYSCEAGEGTLLKSCTGPVPSGAAIDTSTAGQHTFAVTAEDIEHGKATRTVSYTVVPPPSIEIGSPASGASYVQGQAVASSFACHAGAGATLKTCVGPIASGVAIDTATLGQHTFSVSAEDSLGAQASRSASYTVIRAPLPNTTLGSHPKKTIRSSKKKTRVKFSFSSDVAGASFECKLDRGSFTPCSSPKSYKVKRGKHSFAVQAVAAGGSDPTPATFSFKVKNKG